MVFDIPDVKCPKCGDYGLYITQEDFKPVVIKCRHVHTCGWEVDLKQFWSGDLAKELQECLTNGWSDHEKSHWSDYLEEEIKPYWPILYAFLKSMFDRDRTRTNVKGD